MIIKLPDIQYVFTPHAVDRYKERVGKLDMRDLQAHLSGASEEKWMLNDARFMAHYTEKYGYKKFKFLVSGQIVFCCSYENNRWLVLTVINDKSHRAVRCVVRPKFKKKEENYDRFQ